VSVDATGTITAKANGSATVHAAATGSTDPRVSLGVTVAQALASVAVSPTTATIAVSGTEPFTAQPRDSGGTPISGLGAAKWQSSDTTVATIDAASGVATGVKNGGPITITATISGTPGAAQLTVAPPTVTVNWGFAAETTTVTTDIAAGTSVIWHDTDGFHSIQPDSSPPPTGVGPVNAGQNMGPQTFNTPGTYNYHCGVHPSMHGTITVH
jgi:plastocyanin